MTDDGMEFGGEMFIRPAVDCAIRYQKGVARNIA